jgi:hypothetical protein
MAKRRRVKPYARPTSFDSNVLYDIRQYQLNKYGSMASDTKDVEHKVSGGDEIFHVVKCLFVSVSSFLPGALWPHLPYLFAYSFLLGALWPHQGYAPVLIQRLHCASFVARWP